MVQPLLMMLASRLSIRCAALPSRFVKVISNGSEGLDDVAVLFWYLFGVCG
jgi:hypothetical protein